MQHLATQDAPSAPDITLFKAREERLRATNLQRILTQIHADHIGGTPLTTACTTHAPATDLSGNSLYRLYRAWIKAGKTPASLARRYHAGPTKGLPPAFIAHWKQLCLTYRKNEPARQHLLRTWQAARQGRGTIPGYTTPPPPTTTGHPAGWGKRNLATYAPAKRALLAARQGRDAVRATLPAITTTRAKMHYLQERQWDDMWHNFNTIIPGKDTLHRPLQFGALDVATAYAFPPGIRPRLDKNDPGQIALNSRDFRLYYAYILTTQGYSPLGTRENIENGTATLPRHLADHITAHTGGLVTFAASGINRAPAIPGQYKSAAKGNPRHKAHLESYHHLLQNALTHLPGQVGINPDTAPGELAASDRATTHLLQLAAHLPPHLAAQLQHDRLTFAAAQDIIHATVQQLNHRTDHNLEGYREAGHITELYRLSETADYTTLDQIAPSLRAMLALAAQQNPALYRTRLATPAEVRARALATGPQPILLSPLALPDLLPEEIRPRTITPRGTIEFTLDGIKYEYTADLGEGPLTPGKTYDIFANPFDLQHVVVIEPKSGRILGLAPRWQKSDRADLDDITRRTGQVAHDYRAAVAEAASAVGLKRLAAQQHNTRVLRDHTRLPGPLHPTPKLSTRAQFDPATPTEDDLLTPADTYTPEDTAPTTQPTDDLFA